MPDIWNNLGKITTDTLFILGRGKPLLRKSRSREHSSSNNGKRLSQSMATETQRLSLLPDQNRLSGNNTVIYNTATQTTKLK